MTATKIKVVIWLIGKLSFISALYQFTTSDEFKDYELDRAAFDVKHMQLMEERTNLKFPKDTIGLNLYNKRNTIDPEIFAKLEIPADSLDEFEKQIKERNEEIANLTISGDIEWLKWWQCNKSKNIRIDKCYYCNNRLEHVILCYENNHWVLYIADLAGG